MVGTRSDAISVSLIRADKLPMCPLSRRGAIVQKWQIEPWMMICRKLIIETSPALNALALSFPKQTATKDTHQNGKNGIA